MSRSARSGKSLIGRNAADVELVGYADFNGIMEGMADAVVEAIRVGVPTRMLPGHSMFGHRTGLSSVDLWNEKMGALNADLVQATREASAAMDMAVEAKVEGNDDMNREYAKVASRRTSDASRLRRAIDALNQEQKVVARSDPFDVRADVWVPALHRLRTCGGRLSQAEHVHFQTLFPKFKMELVDSTWWAVASLRLNTREGVAELGPVRWPVNAQGRSTVLSLNHKAIATGERRTRQEIVATLVQSGRICRDAAQTVTNAPFRELRFLLLHELCEEPLPDLVGPQWRDPVFVDWIVRVYTDPDWVWSRKGKYGTALLNRQYAVCVLAKYGPMGARDVMSRMRGVRVNFSHLYRPFADRNTHQRAVAPCAVDGGLLPDGQRLVRLVECDCGQFGTVVARAPEVLTDLLCACGRAPGGEKSGMPSGLRFPDEYQEMGMDMAQCESLAAARRNRTRKTYTQRELAVLGRPDLLSSGISTAAIGRALGLKSLSPAMHSLAAQGLIERRGDTTPQFQLWHLTDEGTAAVAALSQT
jgi:hypothetical protein